jgi:hypothetical protein
MRLHGRSLVKARTFADGCRNIWFVHSRSFTSPLVERRVFSRARRLLVVLAGLITAVPIANSGDSVVRGCPGARPNDYCVSSEMVVYPGEYVYETAPPCDKNLASSWNNIVSDYDHSIVPGITQYAGPLTASSAALQANPSVRLPRGLLALGPGRLANCALIAVAIPKGAVFQGARIDVSEERSSQWQSCKVAEDCPVGWSRFEWDPAPIVTSNGILIGTAFKNWSHNRARRARLTVYFTPPGTWAPVPAVDPPSGDQLQ